MKAKHRPDDLLTQCCWVFFRQVLIPEVERPFTIMFSARQPGVDPGQAERCGGGVYHHVSTPLCSISTFPSSGTSSDFLEFRSYAYAKVELAMESTEYSLHGLRFGEWLLDGYRTSRV